MAVRYAVASGNWSNTATWDGGTLPTSSDDVYANGFTVTIDQNVTVLSIRTTPQSPAVVGGTFILTNGITVTANLINGATNAFQFALNSPNSCTIIGNLSNNPLSINVGVLLLISGNGTVNVIGNLTPVQNSQCVSLTGAGSTLNVTGYVVGQGSGGNGIFSTTSANINVNGTVSGGSTNPSQAISLSGAATVTINGILNAGGNTYGIQSTGGAFITINGQVNASTGFSGIYISSTTGAVVLNGNAVNNVGRMAIWAPIIYISNSVSNWKFTKTDLTTDRTLYSADTLPGVPSEINVRQGTIYGPSNELVGTLTIPPSGSVALGVPVDDGVGTAIISITDMGALIASYIV